MFAIASFVMAYQSCAVYCGVWSATLAARGIIVQWILKGWLGYLALVHLSFFREGELSLLSILKMPMKISYHIQ